MPKARAQRAEGAWFSFPGGEVMAGGPVRTIPNEWLPPDSPAALRFFPPFGKGGWCTSWRENGLMNEREWVSLESPVPMMEVLLGMEVDERKYDLFFEAAACEECRKLCEHDVPPAKAYYAANSECALWRDRPSLIRCIFGNPWRPVVMAQSGIREHIDTSLLFWESGKILIIAATIFQDNDWKSMPILGDALEEAGCTNKQVLEHCRSDKPHARGCWVIDLILGIE